jgi:hypothetical protein
VYLRVPSDGLPSPKHPRLLLDRLPPKTIGAEPQVGWIQVYTLTNWFTESSIRTVKPSLAAPEWSSSWKGRNTDVTDLAQAFSGLLPHYTHSEHAFRCSFVLRLNASYAQRIDNWLKIHTGRLMPGYQVASLIAATTEAAVRRFHKRRLISHKQKHFQWTWIYCGISRASTA